MKLAAAAAITALSVAGAAQAQVLDLEVFATGFARPVYVTAPPGDLDRVFVVEGRTGSTGRISVQDRNTGADISTFLLVPSVSTGNEQGLLGMAFHPDYDNNGLFYIYYTDSLARTVVEQVEVSAGDPNVADASSRDIILRVTQPQSNHNGGWIAFGSDGYLYISIGDGGGANDSGSGHNPAIGNSQDLNTNLGKMLRIDVDGDDFPGDSLRDYAIPADNPFVGVAGNDEIWAYGLRNAWRNAFDRETGDLWIADVGQNAREEVNFQPASSAGGENYGWRCYEGNSAFNTSNCDPASTMEFPIHVYLHGGNPFRCSITGGEVYRGCAIGALNQGTYFFADYCSDNVWTLEYDGSSVSNFMDRTNDLESVGIFLNNISGFGIDGYGEMYICSLSGPVYRIVPEGGITDDNENGIADSCEVPACPGDLTTTGSSVGNPGYGEPDGSTDLADLLFFVNVWDADLGSPTPNPGSIADTTTTGASMGDPEFGTPDGDVDLSDLLYYVNEWGVGIVECP